MTNPAITRSVLETLEGRRLLSGDGFAMADTFNPPETGGNVGDGGASFSSLTGGDNGDSGGGGATFSNNTPSVTAVRPANGEADVVRDGFIAADVNLPAGAIDAGTLDGNVLLTRQSDGTLVPSTVQTTGGGDAIILSPLQTLDRDAGYTFTVTTGVRDVAGNNFAAFSSSFTTSDETTNVDLSIAFEKVAQDNSGDRTWTSITTGPDGRLWGTTLDGFIYRFDIEADGSLTSRKTINKIRLLEGGEALITGLAFDPASTVNNPIAWVTFGAAGFNNPDDFTGKIARLNGPLLETGLVLVDGLPRSIKDHMTNQPSFGPDGRLYVPQGSNNAFGAPDSTWGFRPERPLSGSVLAVDTQQLVSGGVVDVTTPDGGGSYDPDAPGAPVTNYATGLRNAYDLVWHSNGNLYAPNNGSAAGGNIPAGNGAPAINNVSETQVDQLYKVEAGRYYGHPNPSRDEFVHSNGNPTAGPDPYQISQYPVGQQPRSNYQQPIYSFGLNQSPNGSIEYTAGAFGGQLDEHLLVTRFSGGNDVLAIKLNAAGDVASVKTNIPGLTNFDDPIDLAEDRNTGNLYVAEYGGQKITLLRPVDPGGELRTTKRSFANEPAGGGVTNTNYVTITNTGDEPLVIPAGGFEFSGANANLFSVADTGDLPLVVRPTQTGYLPIAFNPAAGDSGIKTARLTFLSSDPDRPTAGVDLRGLVTSGEGGSDEPSLQELFALHEFALDSGDSDPTTPGFEPGSDLGDGFEFDYFERAGNGPVSLIPFSVFAPDTNIPAQLGIYSPGSPETIKVRSTVPEGDDQSAFPRVDGAQKFSVEPLTFGEGITANAFGVAAGFNAFKEADGRGRFVYSEPDLNTWEPDANERRKVLAYPLTDVNGNVTPDAYILGFEEFPAAGFPSDFQDVVAIVRNVTPILSTGPEIGFENLSGAPFPNRLAFSRIGSVSGGTTFNNVQKLRVRNTGASTLELTDIDTTSGFSVAGGSSRSVAPGGSVILTVTFTANSGNITEGTLSFNTNDADEPSVNVELGGFWQSVAEQNPGPPAGDGINQEPSLQEILDTFGYTTVTAFESRGETIQNGGRLETSGEEVLSAVWQQADPSLDVRVTQLAAFHGQGDIDRFAWRPINASGNGFELFGNSPDYAQSLLPLNIAEDDIASGTFDNGGFPFLVRVDQEWSDPTLNFQEQPGGGWGHHMRWFPARDREGRTIPNSWLMTMDFAGVNYDFNDNVYLVENVEPADLPEAPQLVGAYTTGEGTFIDWADPQDDSVLGYLVFRSDAPNGRYTRLNDPGFSGTFFLDADAPAGRSYYQVLAYGADGAIAAPSSITIAR